MLEIPPPRATRDYLPEEASARRHVLNRFADTAALYGFQPVETPSFEKVELFSARSGPEIKSSMLVFHADHEEFALRPELTAPICRLAASEAFEGRTKPHRLFYTGSCFRYCRPGSGRYREFTQAGLELLGESGAAADAEVITAACRFLRSIGIDDFVLRIGTVGIYRDLLPANIDPDDRSTLLGQLDRLTAIRELAAGLAATGEKALFDQLNIDREEIAVMQRRTGYSGPYAVADRPDVSSEEMAGRVTHEAEAAMRDAWSKEGLLDDETAEKLIAVSRLRGALEEVVEQARELLGGTSGAAALEDLLAVCEQVKVGGQGELEVVLGIARGLTFYTGATFEICAPAGAGGAKYGGAKYGGGGRYDGLVELFGGAPTPAVGCAFRFDTLMDAFERANSWSAPSAFDVFLVADADGDALRVAEQLRSKGVRVGVGAAAPAGVETLTLDEARRRLERS